MTDRVVVVLDQGANARQVPADEPVLRADDLGVVRGDGVFETLHVRQGQPWLREQHLTRIAASAARLALDLPDRSALSELVELACRAWPADEEGALRLVCTRGPEQGGPATVFATVAPVGEPLRRARRQGVSVVTATLGVTAAARPQSPWLLGGAKSLSYAVNMASLRWAQDAGADDVLWVSAEGFALEAPTATLVWLDGGALCTVPPGETGILPGITTRWLLDHADKLGLEAEERMVRPEELAGMDGVWLASSVRGGVAVRSLDGIALAASAYTAAIQELLGFPV